MTLEVNAMKNLLIRSAAAIVMGLSGMAAVPQLAGAQGIEFQIGPDGLRVRPDDRRCDPRYEDCRRYEYRRRDDDDEQGNRRFSRRSFCTEERALDKAARMGVRRAVVEDSDRRTIEVRGRTRQGERVYLTFGRAPNCPVYN